MQALLLGSTRAAAMHKQALSVTSERSCPADDDGNLVTGRKEISVHYLKGWFWLDFFSSLPYDLMFGSEYGLLKLVRVSHAHAHACMLFICPEEWMCSGLRLTVAGQLKGLEQGL